MINNLGEVTAKVLRLEADEIIGHNDVSAWHAPQRMP